MKEKNVLNNLINLNIINILFQHCIDVIELFSHQSTSENVFLLHQCLRLKKRRKFNLKFNRTSRNNNATE